MPHLPFEIPGPDANVRNAALERQARLTKPPGSLGLLEETAVRLAAWQHAERPSARPAAAVLFAADHPVTVHGVSAYPPAVTAAMLQNFCSGGAAASVLARANRLPLHVVDVGVKGAHSSLGAFAETFLFRDSVADDPAGDIRVEDAMSEPS